MANQEHLDILKQGVKVWNQWRAEHPEIRPELGGANLSGEALNGVNLYGALLQGTDLSGAFLQGADLSGAHLSGAYLTTAHLYGAFLQGADLTRSHLYSADLRNAHLSRAFLRNAHLEGADLSGAILRHSYLTRANLSEADLSEADLSEADLYGAHLNGAHLEGADLSAADLKGADLSEATFRSTIFVNTDLHQVKGLEAVRHLGPSEISISTIYRSLSDFPDGFLRGIGIPEPFITTIHAVADRLNIAYYTCFISYASRDEAFAKRLNADLQNNGVRCWFSPEDIKIGDHYHQRIDEAIRFYDKLVLILSEHAVQSAWVEREVVAAREKEDREQQLALFPLRLDDAVMHTTKAWAADVRRRWHIGDFTQWKHYDAYQHALERLLHDLKAKYKPEV